MQPALPRVILVEDDASIRQFVAMALEDLPLQLLSCPSLDSARAALRLTSDDLALVLLDMMLPDGSGLDLLKDPVRMRTDWAARWVVFSAGMPLATRNLLAELGVEQVLDKPVTLDRLLNCVEAACDDWRASRQFAAKPQDVVPASPSGQNNTAPVDTAESASRSSGEPRIQATSPLTALEATALEHYFFGQLALFQTVKTQTLQRLPDDIAKLERFIAEHDAAQVRRAAHNLKSATLMLGQTTAADLARALEDAAEATTVSLWQGLWHGLRADLVRWLADEGLPAPPCRSNSG